MLQLEVLELLVQNGADLNARTKHDETPAGKMGVLIWKWWIYLTDSFNP